jgi:hypothetical protein
VIWLPPCWTHGVSASLRQEALHGRRLPAARAVVPWNATQRNQGLTASWQSRKQCPEKLVFFISGFPIQGLPHASGSGGLGSNATQLLHVSRAALGNRACFPVYKSEMSSEVGVKGKPGLSPVISPRPIASRRGKGRRCCITCDEQCETRCALGLARLTSLRCGCVPLRCRVESLPCIYENTKKRSAGRVFRRARLASREWSDKIKDGSYRDSLCVRDTWKSEARFPNRRSSILNSRFRCIRLHGSQSPRSSGIQCF